MTEPHAVYTQETPGGDQPLAKAEGHVTGFQTQLDEAKAYALAAADRVKRIEADNDARLADAKANLQQAQDDVNRLAAELDQAEAALPAALQAQAEYDALPQEEKDAIAKAKAKARAEVELKNAQAAVASFGSEG